MSSEGKMITQINEVFVGSEILFSQFYCFERREIAYIGVFNIFSYLQ